MIEFKNVSLVLAERVIFSQLNVTFSAQGISFLVGANGAGKTQLLRLIHGFKQPDSGQIIAPTVREQAFLSQSPILLSRTVAENLAFIRGCPVCPSDYFDAHFDEVVQYFDLQSYLNQQALTLSGGQQKRLAIARLFLQQANYYLIDEPSANVDYQTNLHIEAAIERLANANKKVVLSSHDILQIQRLFKPQRDEILVLYEGQLQYRSSVFDFEEMKPFV